MSRGDAPTPENLNDLLDRDTPSPSSQETNKEPANRGDGAGAQDGAAQEGEGTEAVGSAGTQSRPSTPEEEMCAICLSRMENKSFTDGCFHEFCFACLVEWSRNKASCPLCKRTFKSIIHNVRALDDYDQYEVPAPPVPELHRHAPLALNSLMTSYGPGLRDFRSRYIRAVSAFRNQAHDHRYAGPTRGGLIGVGATEGQGGSGVGGGPALVGNSSGGGGPTLVGSSSGGGEGPALVGSSNGGGGPTLVGSSSGGGRRALVGSGGGPALVGSNSGGGPALVGSIIGGGGTALVGSNTGGGPVLVGSSSGGGGPSLVGSNGGSSNGSGGAGDRDFLADAFRRGVADPWRSETATVAAVFGRDPRFGPEPPFSLFRRAALQVARDLDYLRGTAPVSALPGMALDPMVAAMAATQRATPGHEEAAANSLMQRTIQNQQYRDAMRRVEIYRQHAARLGMQTLRERIIHPPSTSSGPRLLSCGNASNVGTSASGGTSSAGTSAYCSISTAGTSASCSTSTLGTSASGSTSTLGTSASGSTSTLGTSASGSTSTLGMSAPGSTSTLGTSASCSTSTLGTSASGSTSIAGTSAPCSTSTAGTSASGNTSDVVASASSGNTSSVRTSAFARTGGDDGAINELYRQRFDALYGPGSWEELLNSGDDEAPRSAHSHVVAARPPRLPVSEISAPTASGSRWGPPVVSTSSTSGVSSARGHGAAASTSSSASADGQDPLMVRLPMRSHGFSTRVNVYLMDLYAVPIPDDRRRDVSARFFRENPAAAHRLFPWVMRDLLAIPIPYSAPNEPQRLAHLIMMRLFEVDLVNPLFGTHLQDRLHNYTRHFLHEFYRFAVSPYSVREYDQRVRFAATPWDYVMSCRMPPRPLTEPNRQTSRELEEARGAAPRMASRQETGLPTRQETAASTASRSVGSATAAAAPPLVGRTTDEPALQHVGVAAPRPLSQVAAAATAEGYNFEVVSSGQSDTNVDSDASGVEFIGEVQQARQRKRPRLRQEADDEVVEVAEIITVSSDEAAAGAEETGDVEVVAVMPAPTEPAAENPSQGSSVGRERKRLRKSGKRKRRKDVVVVDIDLEDPGEEADDEDDSDSVISVGTDAVRNDGVSNEPTQADDQTNDSSMDDARALNIILAPDQPSTSRGIIHSTQYYADIGRGAVMSSDSASEVDSRRMANDGEKNNGGNGNQPNGVNGDPGSSSSSSSGSEDSSEQGKTGGNDSNMEDMLRHVKVKEEPREFSSPEPGEITVLEWYPKGRPRTPLCELTLSSDSESDARRSEPSRRRRDRERGSRRRRSGSRSPRRPPDRRRHRSERDRRERRRDREVRSRRSRSRSRHRRRDNYSSRDPRRSRSRSRHRHRSRASPPRHRPPLRSPSPRRKRTPSPRLIQKLSGSALYGPAGAGLGLADRDEFNRDKRRRDRTPSPPKGSGRARRSSRDRYGRKRETDNDDDIFADLRKERREKRPELGLLDAASLKLFKKHPTGHKNSSNDEAK